MLELVGIGYSPWTEKARWALDHHAIIYREEEYLPMLGEPALRMRIRKFRGKITVPLLIAGERVIQDSFAIARYADGIGGGAPLFPERYAAEIGVWNERSEQALRGVRAIVSEQVLQNPAAKEEALPEAFPGAMRKLLKPVANVGVAYLRGKYDFTSRLAGARRDLESNLQVLQEALGDRDYLCGEGFSYADIAMALVLQGVKPVTDEFLRLGPATREAWTNLDLCDRFPDLLAWRDRIYEKHR
jgi:glutathione S-transferase